MSSFFTKKETYASESTSMSMKEVLLGVLQSKDLGQIGMVHASDFRQAVQQMGIPLGHAIVEELLMHCHVGADGTINFSELEQELKNQRILFNAKQKRDKEQVQQFKQTSQVINATPSQLRKQDQAERLGLERHRRSLLTHRDAIHDAYKDYSSDKIDADEVVAILESYGILADHHLFRLKINDNFKNGDDLTFREFLTALGSYNPTENPHYLTRQAGLGTALATKAGRDHFDAHSMSNSEEVFARPIRRSNLMSQKLQQDRSNAEGEATFTQKKVHKTNKGDENLYKNSSGVRNSLFMEGDNGRSEQMLTHNKREMLEGCGSGRAKDMQYNVEMKMQREQVLAALRRLDAHTLTFNEFERRLYDIGIDMNPNVLRDIENTLKIGKLNWKSIVALCDKEIFQKRALAEHVDDDVVIRVRKRVGNMMKKIGGHSGLTTLTSIFYRLDSNHNGLVSFNEFKNGCEMLGLGSDQVSVEELRLLFHSMDKDGNGGLDKREFSAGLRGPIKGKRMEFIRDAFSILDHTGENKISLDQLLGGSNLEHHPDVVSGFRTLREIKTDLISFVNFGLNEEDRHLNFSEGAKLMTFALFNEYWSNLSFAIDDDEDFFQTVRQIMGMSELRPKPTLQMAKRTAEGKGAQVASRAVQVHGDVVSWSQEPSQMEIDSKARHRPARRMRFDSGTKTKDLRYSSSFNVHKGEKHSQNIDSDLSWDDDNSADEMEYNKNHDFARDELRAAGNLDCIPRHDKNIGSNNLKCLQWDTSAKGLEKSRQRTQLQYQEKLHKKDTFDAEHKNSSNVSAGAPSGILQGKALMSKRATTQIGIGRNFGLNSPYATDSIDDYIPGGAIHVAKVERANAHTNHHSHKSNLRSLGDMMKASNKRQGPKSLKEIMSAAATVAAAAEEE